MNDGVPLLSKLFTWLFNILGLVFLATGIAMILTIQAHYPSFYLEYGRLLWIATILLTLPLFVRGINSFFYGKHYCYFTWYNDNFALVNSLYVTFSSILPVVTQMSTLVFGARQQFKKKVKIEQQLLKGSVTENDNTDLDTDSDDEGDTSLNSDNRFSRNVFDPPLEQFQF